jgi:hypothetical protein
LGSALPDLLHFISTDIARAASLIALKMVAVQTSETSVNSYQSTRRYNPEDSHLHVCNTLQYEHEPKINIFRLQHQVLDMNFAESRCEGEGEGDLTAHINEVF